MAIEPYWAIQPAFTGGEISGDVASRVDLDNYENFSVDKESGTVTDDSAITADLLSLEAYEIKHMVPGSDLLIFTEGLPVAVDAATVGLPYKMVLEQPNFDAGMTESGTLQGQNKVVSQAVLRLSRSFGGKIGATKDALTEIIYRIGKMQLVESTVGENDVLYTGDLTAGLALGGYNTEGRVYIEHGTPYPFHLSAIIRKVSMHG